MDLSKLPPEAKLLILSKLQIDPEEEIPTTENEREIEDNDV